MKQFLTEEQRQIFLDALEQAEGKKVLYIDLDGVCANYKKNFLKKKELKLLVLRDRDC